MKLSDKKSIQQINFTLASLGLKEVVICPGSRNAPLTISFNRHPAFHCTSIRDERSAAFFALGKSLELRQPVAIVCTSGSAALNFAPAIAEAYYQRIPLLVITADRPVEWTDQGDGQTIRQTDIYKNYIRKSFDLFGDTKIDDELWYNNRCINEGFLIATHHDKGPVHFNIPIREPLYETAEAENKILRKLDFCAFERKLPATEIEKFSKQFSSAKKVMVLVGQHLPDDSFESVLKEISKFENTIILCESTSNIHERYFIKYIDLCISTMTEEEAKEFMPELLITVGRAVVSKRIKALLRKYRSLIHWNIDLYDAFMDTYQSLTDPIFMEPVEFFKQLTPTLSATKSNYKNQWNNRAVKLSDLSKQFFKEASYSDYQVFGKIFANLPPGITLHLANSSPIRYAQLFDSKNIENSWSNRGTSGIDGCTSTAMGAASANPKKDFLLITGDVAFLYDTNALWNDLSIDNLKIILINNGGGGIFRIIAGPAATDELEEFFETKQHRSMEKLAAMHEWNYLSAKDEKTLSASLKEFFQI